jgi:hypothetical protein
MLLPSPDSLLGCFAPKMFNRDLEERKAQFEDDFFVLVLRRMRVDIGQPKGTWITRLGRSSYSKRIHYTLYKPHKCGFSFRVSAVKLSQSFGLCSRSLGVFAFRGGINRMRDALQKCFEHGNIQLKLWQVSAVMHDGTADFVELCKQLDLPGLIFDFFSLYFIAISFVVFLRPDLCFEIFMLNWINWNLVRNAFAGLRPVLNKQLVM